MKLIPRFALAIAAASKLIEGLLPIHLIGASVIALFIGMISNLISAGTGICGGFAIAAIALFSDF